MCAAAYVVTPIFWIGVGEVVKVCYAVILGGRAGLWETFFVAFMQNLEGLVVQNLVCSFMESKIFLAPSFDAFPA